MLSFKVKYAIQILFELGNAARNGTKVTSTHLRETYGFERSGLSTTIADLCRNRMVEKFSTDIRLTANLETTTLYDLIIALDGDLRMGSACVVQGWTNTFQNRCVTAIEIDNRIENELCHRLRQITIRDMINSPTTGHSRPVKKAYNKVGADML